MKKQHLLLILFLIGLGLSANSQDVLLITSTQLEKNPDFNLAVTEFIKTITLKENLTGEYIEIDSDSCLSHYGIKVNNPNDWQEVKSVLKQITTSTGANYVILLGGIKVIPRPELYMTDDYYTGYVPSDQWYIDFDNDSLADNNLSIARFPEFGFSSEAITVALQTSIKLHNSGGFLMDKEAFFTMNDLSTPPYGFCSTCDSTQEFISLMNNSNYIRFAGHGSSTAIYSGTGGHKKLDVGDISNLDLSKNNPLIISYYPCNNGVLLENKPVLSTEFMRKGAFAFLARTTSMGVPTKVAYNLPSLLRDGVRIGDAFFDLIRETIQVYGNSFKPSAGHLCLYGDPTLSIKTYTSYSNQMVISRTNVYPNPASNFVMVKTVSSGVIQLMDIYGHVIFNSYINNIKKIDISDYASGVYFLKINSHSNIEVFKVLKY